MKKIYIYFGEGGKEYSGGAKAELSDTANGNVYAFASSPYIDRLWKCLRERMARHGLKDNAVTTLMSDLAIVLLDNNKVPFKCLRRLNGTHWDCTERCIVDADVALELMRRTQMVE